MANIRTVKKILLDFYLDLAKWNYTDLSLSCGILPKTLENWNSGCTPRMTTIEKVTKSINMRYKEIDVPITIAADDIQVLSDDDRIPEMKRMEQQGKSRTTIRRHFGISRERVRQLLGNYVSIEKICDCCGKPFMPPSSISTFCSRSCSAHKSVYGTPKLNHYDRRLKEITKKIAAPNANGCWEWQGCISHTTGYGRGGWNGRVVGMHRVMWEIVHGSIPDGMYVLHTCDNPPCCNPAHLFLGTAKDNAKDRDSKGRHQTNILDFQKATEIRNLTPELSDVPELAKQFGVHPYTIYSILRGASHAGAKRIRSKRGKDGRVSYSKLTFLQAKRIRDVYQYGNHTANSLALIYKVNVSTIYRILKYKTWNYEITQYRRRQG